MLYKREQNQVTYKLQKGMQEAGFDALILTSSDAIYYATGFLSAFSRMNATSTCAVLTADGVVTVIINQFEKQAAMEFLGHSKDINIETYPTWIYIEDFDDPNEIKDEHPDINKPLKMAAEIIRQYKYDANIGVQEQTYSHTRWDVICEIFGETNVSDCERMLEMIRAYKTPWEIEILKSAAIICEKTMKETASKTVPGMSEAELMTLYNKIAYSLSNNLTGVGQYHTLGECYSPTVIARKKRIHTGDLIRLDVGPEYYGYTTDIARTYAVGKANPAQEKIYDVLYKGHCRAMEMIGPGVKMSDVFNEVQTKICQDGLPSYVRGHFGHSIGTGECEQYPYISASSPYTFEPGMVFCVETPYYGSISNSFNLEDTIVITENGYERFTTVPGSLYWV